MKKIFLAAIIFFSTNAVFGQPKDLDQEEDWTIVDVAPSFPGGYGKFYSYINKNLKYPKDAKKKRIEGRVLVEFIIDSTGYILTDSTKVIQSLFDSCDNEAMRLVNESPQWNPGRQTKFNKNVRVRMRMPIEFKRN